MGAEIWAKNSLFLSEDHENRSSRFVCLLMNSVRVFPFLLWEKVLLAPNVIWLAERIKQGLKSLKRCVIMHNNAIFKSTFSSQLSLNVSEGCVHNSPKHFWKLHFKLQRFKHLLLVLTSHHKEQNKSQKKKKKAFCHSINPLHLHVLYTAWTSAYSLSKAVRRGVRLIEGTKPVAYKQRLNRQGFFNLVKRRWRKDTIRDLNIHECCEEHKEEMMIHSFHNGRSIMFFKTKEGRFFLHNGKSLTCCYRMWWSMEVHWVQNG